MHPQGRLGGGLLGVRCPGCSHAGAAPAAHTHSVLGGSNVGLYESLDERLPAAVQLIRIVTLMALLPKEKMKLALSSYSNAGTGSAKAAGAKTETKSLIRHKHLQ